jgi:hypothetical protein
MYTTLPAGQLVLVLTRTLNSAVLELAPSSVVGTARFGLIFAHVEYYLDSCLAGV